MTEQREAEVYLTEVRVSIVPDTDPEWTSFSLNVSRRGPDSFAVLNRMGECHTGDSNAVYEPLPSSRTDDFKARTRFPYEEAIALAKRLAPDVECMGMTATQYLARRTASTHAPNPGTTA